MHFTTLHGVHCIQSQWMESNAFNRDALGHAAKNTLHSIGMHWASLHGLHCIQLVSIALQCMESSAFNDAARNPLHSIGMLWAMLHTIHCIQSGALGLTACTPLHIIGIHYTTMHGIHCIQSGCIFPGCMESMHSSRCMDSAAYSRDPLRHNAWNPLHYIRIHCATMHGILCIQ